MRIPNIRENGSGQVSIPPHVMLLNKMEAVERMISKQSEEMCHNFRNDLRTDLDERNIGMWTMGSRKSWRR
jgi:hypothetical protein